VGFPIIIQKSGQTKLVRSVEGLPRGLFEIVMKDLGPSVRELRENRFKVKVHHWRVSDSDGELYPKHMFGKGTGRSMRSKGGKTLVEITTPNQLTSGAEAVCSTEDCYCEAVGVAIAKSRVLRDLKRACKVGDWEELR